MGEVSTEYAEPYELSVQDRVAYTGRQMYRIGRSVFDKYVEINDSDIDEATKEKANLIARAVLDSLYDSHRLFKELAEAPAAPQTDEKEYVSNVVQLFPESPARQIEFFNDFAAVEAARQDPEAFEAMLAEHTPLLNSMAAKYYLPTGGNGDDIKQEAMVGFFKAVRDYDGIQSNFESFAKLCVERQVITAVKTATRLKHGSMNNYVSFEHKAPGEEESKLTLGDTLNSRGPSVERQALSNLALPGLVEFINTRLSQFEGNVFRMFVGGESYDAISQELGVSPKNVDNAIQRFRRKIQKYLDEPEQFAQKEVDIEPEPMPAETIAKSKTKRRRKKSRPEAQLPALGLEINGSKVDEAKLGFIGPNERFILEYLSLTQKNSFRRKDILDTEFYTQGQTHSARSQAFRAAVNKLCANLLTDDGAPILEAQGIKAVRQYMVKAALKLVSEPVPMTSLPETERTAAESEQTPIRKKSERTRARIESESSTPAVKRPKKIYESGMSSAEFWKSPPPVEKPRMAFRKAKTETAPLPEPLDDTGTEMRDGKEYKVVILPGYRGRPAPMPEKTIKVGDNQLTVDGKIINLRRAAEY